MPFAAGGPADLVGRAVTTRMSAILGQPMVVDNRGGAGGALGTVYAARATPNGYTLVIANPGSHGTTPLVQRDIAYDPVGEFASVALLGSSTFVLLCNPKLPVKDVRELIAYAKANPGKVRPTGSAGVGSNVHFIGEYFKLRQHAHLVHVPYKGAAPMINDLLAGPSTARSYLPRNSTFHPGKLLAPRSRRCRHPLYPGEHWRKAASATSISRVAGAAGPQKDPAAIIDKLNQTANQVLKQPDTIDQLASIGFHGRRKRRGHAEAART